MSPDELSTIATVALAAPEVDSGQDDTDRSMAFNLLHDVRRDYARQVSTSSAYLSAQANSTPRPISGTRWYRALLPRAPMLPTWPSYAWLAAEHLVLVAPQG